MKERPILFSAPMVQALLAGAKTQTRRLIRWSEKAVEADGCKLRDDENGGWWPYNCHNGNEYPVACPYGLAGDQLWVKESIRLVERRDPQQGPDRDTALFEADGEPTLLDTWPWKRSFLPGVFLPRGLSRLQLEVTALRVERLQDISEADAIAEGISRTCEDHGCSRLCGCASCIEGGCNRAVDSYADLWRDINGPESWNANPWVWAISFKAVPR